MGSLAEEEINGQGIYLSHTTVSHLAKKNDPTKKDDFRLRFIKTVINKGELRSDERN